MHHYSSSQLAIITSVPTVTVILLWTLTIFHKNRKYWQPYDIAIVAIIVQSILRNFSILAYTILTILETQKFNTEYCRGSIWLFNSLHTFQASTLTTLSVIGLYVINLHRKRKEIKEYLSTCHVVYHLFCLTTLCACVGVAAILARHDWSESNSANFEFNYGKNYTQSNNFGFETCQFMPYQLDVKYNVFILSLHTLLALISAVCFIGIVFRYYKQRKDGFTYLKKSTSDLSDLSLGAAASTVSITNQKDEMSKLYFDSYNKKNYQSHDSQMGFGGKNELGHWTSDTSNISTSVSSTNSRRPCLTNPQKKIENQGSGLETILPVLIVCYLFNHLPVVVLCLFPWLVSPFTAPAACLFLALFQDTLLPSGLALIDGRFGSWVSRVYRCSGTAGGRKHPDKPPHGLAGRFRPFSCSPFAPEIQQTGVHRQKFPITNGSLYTSIDGHLPVVHNYRRHKGEITGLRSPVHSVSMGLHSTYIKRQESMLQSSNPAKLKMQEAYDPSFVTLPDYPSLTSVYEEKPTSAARQQIAVSQNTLADISVIENELKKMKELSKSQENLASSPINIIQRDIQNFRKNPEVYGKNLRRANKRSTPEKDQESSEDEYGPTSLSFQDEYNKNFDTLSSQSCCSITTEANCDFEFFSKQDEKTEIANAYKFNNINENDNYIMCLSPNLSSKSGNIPIMRSFKPFDQKNSPQKSPKQFNRGIITEKDFSRNFRITRSNSKRSLDKLDSYIRNSQRLEKKSASKASLNRMDSFNEKKIDNQKSKNPHGTYVIRSSSVNKNKEMIGSFPDISDRKFNQNTSQINYLNYKNLNSSCIHFGDLNDNKEMSSKYKRNINNLDKFKKTNPVLSVESLCSILNHKGISYLDNGDICNHNYGGSVPDFKKIFVSDYI